MIDLLYAIVIFSLLDIAGMLTVFIILFGRASDDVIAQLKRIADELDKP